MFFVRSLNFYILCLAIFLISSSCLLADEKTLNRTLSESPEKIKRFSLVIGKDDGGIGRTQLRYAVADAQSFSKVMEELGGLTTENRILLKNPELHQVLQSFHKMKRLLKKEAALTNRIEFFFYYSGHSNEKGLLIGNQLISYERIKALIQSLEADLNVVILDSCASGVLTRLKGGQKRPPFLDHTLSKLKGNVILTSASASEAAQESDRIKGSYFTHFLISGLRGAADVSGQKKISLNDIYKYSYHNTLAGTENSLSGAQHPSYKIELSGNGELIITDLRKASSVLVMPKDMRGKLSVRDSQNHLIAEVDLISKKTMHLGLEPGEYSLLWSKQQNYSIASVNLTEGNEISLSPQIFRSISAQETQKRGFSVQNTDEASDTDESQNLVLVPVQFGILPNVSTNIFEPEMTENNFTFSLAYGRSARVNGFSFSGGGMLVHQNVNGVQVAGIWNQTEKDIRGVQISGLFNETKNSVQGAQISGGLNKSSHAIGAQIGTANYNLLGGIGAQIGALNMNSGSLVGTQIGAINVSSELPVVGQIGVANFINEGNLDGVQIGGVVNQVDSIRGTQIGTLNWNSKIDGAQIGVLNKSDEVRGVQIGVVNLAKQMKGVQIGVINQNDEDDSFSLGLINISKKSYFQASLAYTDLRFGIIGVRYGSPYAYSLLEFGVRDNFEFSHHSPVLMGNIGMGVRYPFTSYFGLNLEALYSRMSIANPLSYYESAAHLFQLRLLPTFRILSHLEAFFGATVTELLNTGEMSWYSAQITRSELGYDKATRLGAIAGLTFRF